MALLGKNGTRIRDELLAHQQPKPKMPPRKRAPKSPSAATQAITKAAFDIEKELDESRRPETMAFGNLASIELVGVGRDGSRRVLATRPAVAASAGLLIFEVILT